MKLIALLCPSSINKYSLTISSNHLRWIKKLKTPVPDSLPVTRTPLSSEERVSPLTVPSLRPSQCEWRPLICLIAVGTQRRTKKVVTTQTVGEDKKLKATVKKFGKSPNSCEIGWWCRCSAPLRH